MHPLPRVDAALRVADDHAVAAHFGPPRDWPHRDLVGLGHLLAQHDAVPDRRTRREPFFAATTPTLSSGCMTISRVGRLSALMAVVFPWAGPVSAGRTHAPPALEGFYSDPPFEAAGNSRDGTDNLA